ncbi:MAG: phosphatidate cytidylyltransferase [Flavobacteriales bacterium]
MLNKNLLTRTITGTIYGVVLISSLLLGEMSSALFFLIAMFISLHEFYTISSNKNINPQIILGLLTSFCIYSSAFFYFKNIELSAIFIQFTLLFLLVINAIELFRNKENSLKNIAITLFGIFYISVPLSLTFFLTHYNLKEFNYTLLLCIIILIWMSDIGGYFIGSKFGKNKLFERVSPKKTWEGALGGLIFSIISCIIISNFTTVLSPLQWIIFGVVITAGSIIGDLIESMIKRAVNVKDSGTILPGHGGVLDRIDSALFVIPLAYIFLTFVA